MDNPSPSAWTITTEEAGTRLDVFVAQRLEDPSRSAVRRWIDEGHVTVDGERRKAGHGLRRGEVVRAVPPPAPPSTLQPERIPLDIVFEDPDLAVVDKPAGLVVHPGAGNRTGTLANALLHHFQQVSREDSARPGIVHRLDKDTSGLMVVAKNESAHEALARQFKKRKVEKHYLALVYGHPDPPRGTIEAPLGRDPNQRTRMSTRSRRPRMAVTRYRTLGTHGPFALLEVHLYTGRTHQIRVHLEHIGHPVAGDPVYKANRPFPLRGLSARALKGLERQFLHASHLAFRHPRDDRRLEFDSELPDELARILERLE
ncbi:MAG TPA: RluA family pseudouridine synthase [Acidobacteriota bacterium]|nr:RluA family pseudouridine synthase [Acidobacteriota bacterium]